MKNIITIIKYVFLFAVFILIPKLTAQTSGHIDTDSLIQSLKENGDTSYVWSINQNNSWEDLHLFLPKAKIAGITVSINLMPPSKTPPISPTGNYSEPYQLDFISWAKEIANLSLRYSNLIGFGIEDFQENVNLNYLVQSLIDSIYFVGTTINPKLKFFNAGTLHHVFYVDKYATGNSNGTSWKNAAHSISTLNWNNIGNIEGDTIYISGGTDSTTYDYTYLSNKKPPYQVVITKGRDAGHNGDVYFSNTTNVTCFNIGNCQNIKLTNLYFTSTHSNMDMVRLNGGGTQNTIDNCHIISYGNGTGIFFNIESRDTISNNYIEIKNNNLDSTQDCIWIGYGTGGHVILGNTLISHGHFGTYHPDLIQIYGEGSTESLQMIISDNLMIMDNTLSYAAQGLYMENMGSNRISIYNNIIMMNTQRNAAFRFLGNNEANISIRLLNNTFVQKSDILDKPVVVSYADTLIAKNNVILSEGKPHIFLALGYNSVNDIIYKDIDYNFYHCTDGINDIFVAPLYGGYTTWQSWKTKGFDIHSDTSSVILANIWGHNILDYKVINFYDSGIDLSGYFKTDIQSILRPKGVAWDKGAIESQ